MPRGKPFKKGFSGNPGGRPREVGDLRELAREHTEEALQAIIAVMNDPEAPAAARVAAAGLIWDRGYGKAVQSQEITVRQILSIEELEAKARAVMDRIRFSGGTVIDHEK